MVSRASIDATDVPELRRIAERVRDTNEPIVVRMAGEDIAVVVPVAALAGAVRPPSQAQIDAVMSAAGSWQGLVDVDRLKAEWRAARGSIRPPVEF